MKIRVSVPDGPLWVKADRQRMQQVQANILVNAIKYSPEGQSVDFGLRINGENVVIAVKDNGEGIPEPMVEKIFDLFYQSDETLDRSQGGMGVGLTLVKRLVEMHNGSVRVESEGSGKGSLFRSVPTPGCGTR